MIMTGKYDPPKFYGGQCYRLILSIISGIRAFRGLIQFIFEVSRGTTWHKLDNRGRPEKEEKEVYKRFGYATFHVKSTFTMITPLGRHCSNIYLSKGYFMINYGKSTF